MRLMLRAVAAIVLVAACFTAAAYLAARRSLPVVNGTIAVAGLSAPIDIIRDADAIPHIFASTRLDALFGLGYVHAQDRLWQMEFQRRIGHGRLSEIFGAATLPQDRFLRTVGFGRAARQAWTTMPDWAKTQVNAYVAGVNAFISTHHGTALPPEFSLLRFEPEPWTGVDVLVWVKMMAWDLSANYTFELLRHDLAAVVGDERMTQLMPAYPHDGLSILSTRSTTVDTENTEAKSSRDRSSASPVPSVVASSWAGGFASALSGGVPAVRDFLLGNATTEALGSNNWVVDGSLTASGKPMLANDPHLSTHLPSTWYLAHMSAPDFDVVGATMPGAPAVALGRNRFISWGATNVAADVQDLYREHIDPTGRFAEFRGVQESLQIVAETIDVKGAAPVHVNVRVTRHGPLISDAINAMNADLPAARRAPGIEPLAFRWTALDPDDSTLTAFLLMNQAKNWSEFTGALRSFVVPSQNFVYADVDGHIGYYAPGRIPIRAHGDGARPADGWTGDAEWTGWVPFGALPHLLDPPDHFIVTANNRPAPESYPYMLGLEWTEPYRAQRITDLLRSGFGEHRLNADDFAAIQHDTLSLHAQALLPLLLAHAHPDETRDRQALDVLRSWNFDARGDLSAPAIFEAWFLRLAPTLAGDELGPLLMERYQGRFSFVARFVANTLTANDATWCDDVRTARKETCDEAVTTALHQAVLQLSDRLGGDIARWRWDGAHHAIFPHQGLDTIAALRPLLSRSVPNGGDWSTVDAGPVSTDEPFEQRSVPGYREIIDLSPANDSRYLVDVGESGHFLSPHYADFLPDWKAVRLRKMRMERTDIDRGAIGHLRLTPP
ncbi:MAG TPA: penicillin acylase family protein [Vicinamibacterales bacterium]|nr:penicillin acylase family protein [Vicinamibacterales bacterium]